MKALDDFLNFTDKKEILERTSDPDEIWELLERAGQKDFKVPLDFLYAVSNPEIFLIILSRGLTPFLGMYIIGQISQEKAFELGAQKEEIDDWKFFDDGSVFFRKEGGWL